MFNTNDWSPTCLLGASTLSSTVGSQRVATLVLVRRTTLTRTDVRLILEAQIWLFKNAHHGTPLLHFCFASRQLKHAACCLRPLSGSGLPTALEGSASASISSGILVMMQHRCCDLAGGWRCCRMQSTAKRCRRPRAVMSALSASRPVLRPEYRTLGGSSMRSAGPVHQKPSLLRSSGRGERKVYPFGHYYMLSVWPEMPSPRGVG
jgi:hypothetical protein